MKPIITRTVLEYRILCVLLKELRQAMRSKAMLTITLDPYLDGSGCYVISTPNETGRKYTVET